MIYLLIYILAGSLVYMMVFKSDKESYKYFKRIIVAILGVIFAPVIALILKLEWYKLKASIGKMNLTNEEKAEIRVLIKEMENEKQIN